MRVVPTEFAVVQLGVKRDFVAAIFRNVQAIVGGVRSPGRNQMYVNDGARGPGIALVDDVAVAVNLEGTIKMRAGFDGAFAVVLDLAAPENRLAFFVGSLEFQPNVESIDSAAGEKVAYLARAHDDVDAHIVAAAHGSVGAIDGSGNRAKFTCRPFRQLGFGFFADCKSCGKFLFA